MVVSTNVVKVAVMVVSVLVKVLIPLDTLFAIDEW